MLVLMKYVRILVVMILVWSLICVICRVVIRTAINLRYIIGIPIVDQTRLARHSEARTRMNGLSKIFPSGVYLYRLEAGNNVSLKKLVLMK